MMLGVVASDGKAMPPYWFPQGLKISQKVYQEVLENVVKPWIVANYPNGRYVWQQDSAPAHKTAVTQAWCQENFANFWPWAFWPPSSPDCNPLDYAVWGVVERQACRSPHCSVADLKAAVEEQWAALSPEFIRKSCTALRPCLETMIAAQGGHFEI